MQFCPTFSLETSRLFLLVLCSYAVTDCDLFNNGFQIVQLYSVGR
jgi:hypothetical protein